MKVLKINSRNAGTRLCPGFTVMEATVAVAVVGVVVIALYTALTFGFNQVQFGREDMRATQIMVRTMDQLRLFNWDQATNSTTIPTTFLEPFNPDDPTPDIPGHGNGHGKGGKGKGGTIPPLVYSGNVSIDPFPESALVYSPDVRQVTVKLDWTSASGKARSRSLTTFIARYGLQNYLY